MVAGGQRLRFQSAGVLELLDCGELWLCVAFIDGEAYTENKKRELAYLHTQGYTIKLCETGLCSGQINTFRHLHLLL